MHRVRSERFREARRTKGYTQAQIAAALAVRRETVSAWENGQEISRAHLRQLGPMLGVSCMWLEGLRPDPTPPVWLSPDEQAWLALYRNIEPSRRQGVIDALRESKKLFERLT
jgi:DNA-binding XRE family transcriptional regulator